MSKIERYKQPDNADLQEDYYTLALLSYAGDVGELNEAQYQRTQLEILTLLADKMKEYLHDDSNSMPEETARSILSSNLYTIGLYLKSLSTPTLAIQALQNKPIADLYQKGFVLLNHKINHAKRYYNIVQKTKLKTLNQAYNDTVVGLATFFAAYNPRFEAHETPVFIDYPPALPVNDITGAEYMLAYLKSLCIENLFCMKFSPTAIHRTMLGYDRYYSHLLTNIFEQVLTNAIGCALLDKTVLSLDLLQPDIKHLQAVFAGKTEDQIVSILGQAAEKMMNELAINGHGIKKHITATLNQLTVKVKFFADINKLQTIFVTQKVKSTKPIITFSMGNTMDNKQYRAMIDELQSCRFLEDKLTIIKQKIKSLADMEDMLLDSILTENESNSILAILSDTELAVLLKRNPLISEIEAIDFTEYELKLQRSLNNYLKSLSKERQNSIRLLIKQIKIY